MSPEIPEKRCWKWYESGEAMRFVRKHAVARGVWGMGVTNHWTEVDWTGLDWTHQNVRNKLINHRKQN